MDEERIFAVMGAHFSKRLAENPWRGVLPKFDIFMERYDVYYFNTYWYIVKGRTLEWSILSAFEHEWGAAGQMGAKTRRWRSKAQLWLLRVLSGESTMP